MKYSVIASVLLAASAASAMRIPRHDHSNGEPAAVGAPADVDAPIPEGTDPSATNPEVTNPDTTNPDTTLPEEIAGQDDGSATANVPAPGTPAPGTTEPDNTDATQPEIPTPDLPGSTDGGVSDPAIPETEIPDNENTDAGVPTETPDAITDIPGQTQDPSPGADDATAFPGGGEVETVAIDRDDFYRVYKFVKKLVRTGDYASLVALQVLTDEALDLFDDEGAPEIQGGPGSFDNNGASYHSPGGLHQSKRTVNNSGGGFRGFGGAFGRIG